MLTFAIGDVHGRYDLLKKAFEAMAVYYAEETDAEKFRIVMLGDYVDRGPQSKQVIDFLLIQLDNAKSNGLFELICMKGNHEDMMVDALEGRRIGLWLGNGGYATIKSYLNGMAFDRDNLGKEIPQSHIDWLKDLPTSYEDDLRIFVHAGLMPNVLLKDQNDESLMWIRDRFLDRDGSNFPDGKHIVHGHTPIHYNKPDHNVPELLEHRTNLDTAAYFGGILSVGVFDDKQAQPLKVLSITME